MSRNLPFVPRAIANAAWAILLCAWLVPGALAQPAVATPVISPTSGGIRPDPDGLDVTVTCEKAGTTIYYTLDGTDPNEASAKYTDTVHLTEQTGLTAIKTVTLKAKAFTDADESAVAEAQFTNFVDPEFSMKLAVAGTEGTTVPGPTELEFGYRTGATDNYDAAYDGTVVRNQVRDEQPPIPLPPEVDIRFITADSQLTSVDYRSRTQTKEWMFQAQLIPGGDGDPAEVVLSWGHDAAGGFGLPPASVPYLAIVRRTVAGGDAVVGDLTQAGTLTINRAIWPAEADEMQGDDDLYRVFYIVYRNQGTLTANLSPEGVPGQWYYRGLDRELSDKEGPFASGATANVYPGTYEICFETTGGGRETYYAPPAQTVTVAAEETTTVEATFFAADPATATLDVLADYYDPEGDTVQVQCTFTYSPDVTLQSLVWAFDADLPPGAAWTLLDIEGQDAGSATFNGRTITFANTRAIPAGNTIQFVANFAYEEQVGDPADATFQAVVTADFADPIVDFEKTLSGVSKPRIATLDVNGDGKLDRRDVILIFRYLPPKAFGLGKAGDEIFPEGAPQETDKVDAALLTENIVALLPLLDVNKDPMNKANRRDLILIFRYLPPRDFGFGKTGNEIFPEGAPQEEDGVDADELEQNIKIVLGKE